ncbi:MULTISPECIES: hypothetical protein, partial [unclassified Ensifer]|uniref:hypothetical protein n=1 Tax=unclassified Ensifer TaxID=2633371 RepID=UPI00190FC330
MRHNLLGFAALAATVSLVLSTGVQERSLDLAAAFVGVAHAQESESSGVAGGGLGNGAQGLGGAAGAGDPAQSEVKPDTAVDRTRLG